MNKTILTALALTLALGVSSANARSEGPAQHGPKLPQFSAVDADGNGEITLAEINAIAATKFAESDSNNDGFLDAAELTAQFEARMERADRGPRDGQGPRGEQEAQTENAPADEAAPADNAERAERMEARKGDVVERMIERADTNDDGKLSFAEVTESRPTLPFDKIDTDASGSISETEWHVAIEHRDGGDRERGNGRSNR